MVNNPMIKNSEQITEKIMTAKDFVDTLMKDDNIGAEEAFTNAMSSKVSDALEKKRIELSKAYVSQPPPEEEETDE